MPRLKIETKAGNEVSIITGRSALPPNCYHLRDAAKNHFGKMKQMEDTLAALVRDPTSVMDLNNLRKEVKQVKKDQDFIAMETVKQANIVKLLRCREHQQEIAQPEQQQPSPQEDVGSDKSANKMEAPEPIVSLGQIIKKQKERIRKDYEASF